MAVPQFWENQEESKDITRRLSRVKKDLDRFSSLEARLEDLQVLIEMGEEENETSLIQEIHTEERDLTTTLENLRLRLLLGGEHDDKNAILAIHPGAGGTESMDWAKMLLRMYSRWGEKEGYEVDTLDFLPGEEAGVKSVTLLMKGPYAYGYLKSEKGVHRLVRISPFDSSGRRHTSFTSVDVLPEIDDTIEVDINEDDLVIDTYRASGAGGQHVNKTDSAVRITHLPTKITVQCQNERSQHKNRAGALKILKSRLFDYYEAQQREEMEELRGEYQDIAWGSQIRSYILHPYQLIKDHRTEMEMGDVDRVMDGDLEPFITAYLRLME